MPFKDQFNVLVMGTQNILDYFATDYFSVQTSPRKGLTFSKFPPEPINYHKKTVVPQDNFNLFLASSYLLKPLVEPKELGRMDGIMILMDPGSSGPFSEIFPYLEKAIMALQSFVPTHLYAYFSRGSLQTDEIFFKMVEISNVFKRIFENSVDLMHLHEGVNQKSFAGILGKLRKAMIKTQSKGKLPKLKIQGLLNEVKKRILQIERKTYSMEDKLALLMDLEQKIHKPLTKRFLIQRYGLKRDFVIDLLNNWEIECLPAESTRSQVLNDALAMHQKSVNAHLDPNYVNFASLGYTPTQIQQYIPLLKQNNTLEPKLCAFHLPHKAYADYLNLKEFILLYKDEPRWNRRPTGSDEDKIVLFSALIQAIELLRNDFFQRFEDIEPSPRADLEILDFGPLKSVIGQSKGLLKIIARLKSPPSPQLLQRIRKFLGAIDKISPSSNQFNERLQRLFSETFNPFPIYVQVYDRYHLEKFQLPERFTNLEQQIIENIKNKTGLTLLQLAQGINNAVQFGESDIITTIIELIRQGIIKIEH